MGFLFNFVDASFLLVDHTSVDKKQLVEAICLLNEFFEDDYEKIVIWLEIENPLLGNVAPVDLFARGRGHKVIAFIRSQLDDNGLN